MSLEGKWAAALWLLLPFYSNVGIVGACLEFTVTNSSIETYRPPQTEENLSLFPPLHPSFTTRSLKIKRAVFQSPRPGVTLKAAPPLRISMTSNLQSLGEKHTPHSVSAAVNSFNKKSAGSYQTEPHLPYEPIAASQTGFTTNQTAKHYRRKSASALGQPPPLPKWFTPPKNRVFLHGWFEEAQVCCVFRANVCA